MELGTLQKNDGQWELRFVRELDHPPEKVWKALTENDHLEAWFPTTIEGERVAGAALRFIFPMENAPVMEGEMVAYDPPKMLEFRWGEELLRFELIRSARGCTLTFVNTFDELGKATRDAAGWHGCFDVLDYVVAGTAAPFDKDNRWREYQDEYEAAFPPEASTIGPPDWAEIDV